MTFSELQPDLAESAIDGDLIGDATTYAKKGISASFEQFGATIPATYLESLGSISKAIILDQKWIALFGQGVKPGLNTDELDTLLCLQKTQERYLRTMELFLPDCHILLQNIP